MHASNYDYSLSVHAVIQAVWKSAQQDAARFAMKDGEARRVSLNQTDCCAQRKEKLRPGSGSLLFVPLKGVLDIGPC